MKIRPLITALSLVSLGIFGVSCNSKKTASNGGYDDGAYVGGDQTSSGEYDNVYETGGGDDDSYSYESNDSGGSSYNYESNDYSSSPAPSKPTYTPAPSKPTYTPAPSKPTYQPAPASSGSSHTVQRGDTLFNISRRYGTTVGAIQSANGLSGDLIRIGETLTIP